MRTTYGFLAIALLASCAGAPPPPADAVAGIGPEQAVMKAAAAPRGVNGTFVLTVRATGRRAGMFYINSERDYRDQRNLTIAMPIAVADVLQRRYSALPDDYLIGKSVAVAGTARRVKISFTVDGRPTAKYYYQTHVTLASADRLTVSERH